MAKTEIPPDPSFLTPDADGAILAVRVIPRAGRSRIAGIRDGALLVRLAAAPVDGAANAALLVLLADAMQLPRRSLALTAGERSRDKRVRIAGVSASTLAARIAELLHE